MDSIPRLNPEPGLKFLNSLPSSLTADFQLGMLPFSRLHSLTNSGAFGSSQCSSFGDSSSTPVLGFNYSASAVAGYGEVGGCSPSAGHGHANSTIASSIESLSSINQDLHWKLQQQRLAMFFGGQAGPHKDGSSSMPSSLPTPFLENQQEPVSLEAVERSKDDGLEGMRGCAGSGHNNSPAWFVESSYTMPIATVAADTAMTMATNNSSGSNTGIWNGSTPWPAWNDMPQFGTLP
ncbi:dof zinc finger protein DOF5.7-like [Canna indica]|uniref:Dof zinc finger protein DOF5.7-like n=1 Tax=Canna indica TaxID=4628 RepID=A0AAQ3JMQ7_9LILI|nr:dof zinc finger protein DOF5.7-like [Canna indica]